MRIFSWHYILTYSVPCEHQQCQIWCFYANMHNCSFFPSHYQGNWAFYISLNLLNVVIDKRHVQLLPTDNKLSYEIFIVFFLYAVHCKRKTPVYTVSSDIDHGCFCKLLTKARVLTFSHWQHWIWNIHDVTFVRNTLWMELLRKTPICIFLGYPMY